MEQQQQVLAKLPQQFMEGEIFRTELNAQQLSTVAYLLPRGYSLQVDNRKRDTKHHVIKKKTIEEPIYSFVNSDSAAQGSYINQSKQAKKGTEKLPKKDHKMAQSNKSLPSQDQNQTLPENLKPCLKIFNALTNAKSAWPFKQPVDPVTLGIPNYFEIIQEPMDLSTIEKKLAAQIYTTPNQFHSDINKIISNSYTYNISNPEFIKLTADFQKSYEKIAAENKFLTPTAAEVPVPRQVQNNPTKQQKKKKKPTLTQLRQMSESQPVTLAQKQELAFNIRRLAKEHLRGIVSIVFDTGVQIQDTFDIEKLEQKKIRELQKYVRHKIILMEHALKLNQQERNENPDTNDIQSDEESMILDSDN